MAFAQRRELIGARCPAAFKAHLLVLFDSFVGPVACPSSVASALALRLDFPEADHERPLRLELAVDSVGDDEPTAFVKGQEDAVLREALAVGSVEGHFR